MVDASGLCCPDPLMAVRRRLRELEPGKVLLVIATDPTTTKDIPDYCRFLGHELVAQRGAGGVYRYWIRKGGG